MLLNHGICLHFFYISIYFTLSLYLSLSLHIYIYIYIYTLILGCFAGVVIRDEISRAGRAEGAAAFVSCPV